MKFTKMQGCGNDYVYVNGMEESVLNKTQAVPFLSDRHFGIGGDGVIFINKGEKADFEMEMYNADGSRSQMCGNGIRCVGKFVYDKGLTDQKEITVESFGAVKYLTLTVGDDNKVAKVKVDMDEPELQADKVPVVCEKEQAVKVPVEINGKKYEMTCVSMGNPHAVIFVDDITDEMVWTDGKALEVHSCFPERANIEFVQVIDRNHIKMRVWERGSGETFACGTGSCACVVAGVLNGLTDRKVTVSLLGGDLDIEWNAENNRVYMTGPAVTVFEGEIFF
ncbi:MAG: diaminopimelate epimerase [Lachnospiraceae bacterium]|nr:diaminopimelate epimerase [Lachnospiraceae bacterium]